MKKWRLYSKFLFGLFLGISLMSIPLSFAYADLERGYNAVGGEVFTTALPIFVLWWRAWSVKQLKREKQERNRARNQRLAQQLLKSQPKIVILPRERMEKI